MKTQYRLVRCSEKACLDAVQRPCWDLAVDREKGCPLSYQSVLGAFRPDNSYISVENNRTLQTSNRLQTNRNLIARAVITAQVFAVYKQRSMRNMMQWRDVLAGSLALWRWLGNLSKAIGKIKLCGKTKLTTNVTDNFQIIRNRTFMAQLGRRFSFRISIENFLI